MSTLRARRPGEHPIPRRMYTNAKDGDDLAFQAWCLPLIDRLLVEYPRLPPMVVAEQVQLVAGRLWTTGTGPDALHRTAEAARGALDALIAANAIRPDVAALGDIRSGNAS